MLISKAGRIRVSELSIRQFASLVDFEAKDGMVFERVDESENIIEGDIGVTRNVYMRGDSWYLLVKALRNHWRA